MHNKNLRTHRIGIKKIQCNSFTIGNDSPLFLIAGPCLVEDISICKEIAKEAKRICNKYGLNYIFKASFDKSNKTIPNSYRGPGWEKGLEQLKQIKKEIQTPIITDIHEREQCKDSSSPSRPMPKKDGKGAATLLIHGTFRLKSAIYGLSEKEILCLSGKRIGL